MSARHPGIELQVGACRLSTSPDGWVLPRATRCCLELCRQPRCRELWCRQLARHPQQCELQRCQLQHWRDGIRIRTSPRDGASGTSTSLTPTAATTFLLDLWTRPSCVCRTRNGRGGCPSCELPTVERLWPTAWTTGYDRACGGGTTPISPAPWGLTRHPIPASLALEPWLAQDCRRE